ncbi:transposase [Calidithermus timidus]|uniref:transposase n=1 Tax=Calidithermus timidus TaxID=307124 RepID=UPI000698992D|nr:transposase [Calidithermus timidus]
MEQVKHDLYGQPTGRNNRRSIRLKGYDYAQQGAYFITICTQNRARLFGEIVDGQMRLNEWNRIVAESWQWLAEQYEHVELDEWVIMPNHLHGIIVIVDDGRRRGGSQTAPTGHGRPMPTTRKPIGRLVGAFKMVSTKRMNEMRGTPGAAVWQRNYYEHIIRNEESLNRIRQYIAKNPLRWHLDRENPITEGATTQEKIWRA